MYMVRILKFYTIILYETYSFIDYCIFDDHCIETTYKISFTSSSTLNFGT